MITPQEVAAKVSSGDRVYAVIGHECPELVAALIARGDELSDIEIRKIGGFWEDYGIYTPEWASRIRVNVSFATTPSRPGVADGIVDFTVVGFGEVNRHIDQGRPDAKGYDHCWFTVTPPDEDGYCCVGTQLWDLRSAMRNSKLTFAGVNPHLPRTVGNRNTWLHVSEIDFFFEHDEPALERVRRAPTAEAKAIAGYVSTLVRDGDTIHVGAGRTTFALPLLGAFDEKNDLGYFAETTPPGVVDLARQGVITSKYATLRPNKFVTTGLTVTGPDEAAFVDGNPFFEFFDYEDMLSPAFIARNDNLVAIHNALAVDLLGQITVASVGPRLRAGTGGQLGFHVGAFLSKGGRAVTVLPSTTTDGRTRIVATHPPGQIVTIPWDLADTVVTEYGVAELLGKSIRRRAEALIAIAHPDARDELRRALKGIG